MRQIVLKIFPLLMLVSCTEILRQPNLGMVKIEEAKVEANNSYKIIGYEASLEVVQEANRSPFVRYVNVGGSGTGPVTRIPESSLFSGEKPSSNVKPSYILGAGDTVLVTRSGYSTNTNGVDTKQTHSVSYTINESGEINLLEGPVVLVQGLTIKEARQRVGVALENLNAKSTERAKTNGLPSEEPPVYLIGPGDVIRVSRLLEQRNTTGFLTQNIQTSLHTVDPDGSVSILQLGDILAAGLTHPELRDLVLREAARNGGGVDTVVEIEKFAARSASLTGDLGTQIVPITTQPQSFADLVLRLKPSFVGGRDYLLTLSRNGETFRDKASSLVTRKSSRSFVLEGDLISIEEILPKSEVDLSVGNFGSKVMTYLRVRHGSDALSSQQGRTVAVDSRGMDLKQLLIGQGVNINHNEDLLIRLNRDQTTYKLSAKAVILNEPSERYWLLPDDHIVVEDIAYVGDEALLVGEIGLPKQLPIDRYNRTTLSKALFAGGAFSARDADFRHVYILRGQQEQFAAYHFDISKVLNLSLAEQFELRPGDIMFVRTRPLSRYTQALSLALNFVSTLDVGVTNARSFGR